MPKFWEYSRRNPVSPVYTKFKKHKLFVKKIRREPLKETKFDDKPIYVPNPCFEMDNNFKETIK